MTYNPVVERRAKLLRMVTELKRRQRYTDIQRARRSLLAFTTFTYPDYRVNWHHEVICAKLDDLRRGVIRKLIIEAPPRHGKSELASRRFPAYCLGHNPDERIIATSYGDTLAAAMNRDVQRIIDTDDYRMVFPSTTLWGKNVRTVAGGTYLRNSEIFEVVNHRGYYRSAGIGSGITGMGAGIGIIDDPIKSREEAESETYRNKVWNWYLNEFRTRLERIPGGEVRARQLLMLTRWNEDDLAGRILKAEPGEWTVVRFPALMDEDPEERDPEERRALGEALWPDKMTREELEHEMMVAGPYVWESVWQQRPHAREGGMFPRAKVRLVSADDLGDVVEWVRYWDTANSDEYAKGARTAGVRMGRRANGRYVVANAVVGHWPADQRNSVMDATIQLDNNRWVNWVEQEPGGSGKESAENHAIRNAGYRVRVERPMGNKVVRADPFSAQWLAGNVDVVMASWTEDYLTEMEGFPNGRLKDQTDASSGAFSKVTPRRTSGTSTNPADYPKAKR